MEPINGEPLDEEIDDFITLWEEDFGERLEREVARSKVKRLLHFFMTLANFMKDQVDDPSHDDTMQK